MAWGDKGMFYNSSGTICRNKHGAPKKQFSVSIRELADLFGVTQQTIIRWKNNKLLNPNSLESICELYSQRSK